MEREREWGQVLPLVCLVIVVAGVAMVGLGRLGTAAVLRAKATTAADAAALAGAAEGEGAANALAQANGAEVTSFAAEGADREVRVDASGAAARARARRTASPRPPHRSGGVAPPLRAALSRAEQLLGHPIPVTSGFRTSAQQAALWAARATNPFPVAPPGTSKHERGLAVDVPRSFVPHLAAVAAAAGLCHPYPTTDPVHFEVCGHG